MLGDKVGSTAIGPSGWALFPLLDGNKGFGETLAIYTGGLLVGYLAGFVATYFWGFGSALLEEFDVDTEPPTVTSESGERVPTPA